MGCSDYKKCPFKLSLPPGTLYASVLPQSCEKCNSGIKIMHFKFKKGAVLPALGTECSSCVVCDPNMREMIEQCNTAQNIRVFYQALEAGPVFTVGGGSGSSSSGSGTMNDRRGGGQQNNNNSSSSFLSDSYTNFSRGLGTSSTPSAPYKSSSSSMSTRTAASVTTTTTVTVDESAPVCSHGQPCVKRTTTKEGPNKGREFYVCGLPREEQCKTFVWADEVGQQSNVMSGSHYSTGGASARKRDLSSYQTTNPTAASSLTCFACNEPGHFATNCPNKTQGGGNYSGNFSKTPSYSRKGGNSGGSSYSKGKSFSKAKPKSRKKKDDDD